MKKADKQSIIAVPIVVILAAGISFAGSQGGVKAFGIPIFALCVGLAFIIQWIAFIPAYINKTEKFYDLTGSFTYIIVTLVAVLCSPSIDTRTLLFLGVITIWAIRLGYFLFRRIHQAGEDRRFREIKRSFPRFLLAWTTQGLWVTFSLAAALAAITSKIKVNFDVFSLVGFLIWLSGFCIEVIADWQKSKFRTIPENKERFINVGLWSWSRHPNYFGELVLWIGVSVIALPVLRSWQWITLISPVFIFILLTRISGIPMLESRADERWGGQEDYELYKARTPVLIPRPPSELAK